MITDRQEFLICYTQNNPSTSTRVKEATMRFFAQIFTLLLEKFLGARPAVVHSRPSTSVKEGSGRKNTPPCSSSSSPNEALLRKVHGMPSPQHTMFLSQACPKCGSATIACCHTEAEQGDLGPYDFFCHVCCNQSCDYYEYREEHTTDTHECVCPFCKYKIVKCITCREKSYGD